MELKIVKTHPDSKTPTYGSEHASGLDLYSTESYALRPQETMKIDIGLRLEIPIGYEGQIRGRSGLASIGILSHVGTADADYKGNICVILYNSTNKFYEINKGDRVGQLIIASVLHKISIKEISLDELTETDYYRVLALRKEGKMDLVHQENNRVFNILKKLYLYFFVNNFGGFCSEKDNLIDKITIKDKSKDEIEKIRKELNNENYNR